MKWKVTLEIPWGRVKVFLAVMLGCLLRYNYNYLSCPYQFKIN